MSRLISGSLCLSEILEQAKARHSAFSKAENGKIYFNIKIWENDEPDKFGNDFGIQLNPKKDAPESEDKKYIGNAKRVKAKDPQPLFNEDVANIPSSDDLPF